MMLNMRFTCAHKGDREPEEHQEEGPADTAAVNHGDHQTERRLPGVEPVRW